MKPTLHNTPMQSFSVENLECRTLLANIDVADCENIKGKTEFETLKLQNGCLDQKIFEMSAKIAAANESYKLARNTLAQLEKVQSDNCKEIASKTIELLSLENTSTTLRNEIQELKDLQEDSEELEEKIADLSPGDRAIFEHFLNN